MIKETTFTGSVGKKQKPIFLFLSPEGYALKQDGIVKISRGTLGMIFSNTSCVPRGELCLSSTLGYVIEKDFSHSSGTIRWANEGTDFIDFLLYNPKYNKSIRIEFSPGFQTLGNR